MTAYEFVFSNKRKYRLQRHLFFWLGFLLQTVMVNTQMSSVADFFKYQSYQHAMLFAVSVLLPCVFSVYMFLYFLFPLFQQKKYAAFIACFVVVIILDCVISLFFYLITRNYTCVHCKAVTLLDEINMTEVLGINMAGILGVAALGIKFTKTWYLQQARNRILARQKITSELKLLKARIQPDLLFDTLQALYNKITSNNNEAAEMLLKFSELLSYTLYECDDDFVAAGRVLKITDEFIALEKMIRKTNIKSVTTISGNTGNKYIPSFIVFPLIQQCVIALHKHPGETHSTEIELSIEDNTFYCAIYIETDAFSIIRKFYINAINTFTNRLETFYSNKYTLNFNEEGKGRLVIKMSLVLSDIVEEVKATEQVYAYTHV